jgi:threonine dehydrogenase-like Zn-dependent dehydrogenase
VVLVGTRDSRSVAGLALTGGGMFRSGNDASSGGEMLTAGPGADYRNAGTRRRSTWRPPWSIAECVICSGRSHDPVTVDLPQIVRNNTTYGIPWRRNAVHQCHVAFMAERRFDARLVHTHSFPLAELPEAATRANG